MTEAAAVHREIVDRYLRSQAAGRVEPGALDLVDDDVLDHRGGTQGDYRGIDAWRRRWETAMASTEFHDTVLAIEQNVSSGEYSTNRYRSRGVHTDTGRGYDITGIDMIRVVNGKIVEHWALRDSTAMRHQLRG